MTTEDSHDNGDDQKGLEEGAVGGSVVKDDINGHQHRVRSVGHGVP